MYHITLPIYYTMSLLINRVTPTESPLTAHCNCNGQITMAYLAPPPVIYVRTIDITYTPIARIEKDKNANL